MLLLLSVFAAVLACSSLGFGVSIPPANGPYGVLMELFSLTDHHRIDPYAPRGSSAKRRVMCSAFIPQAMHGEPCILEYRPYMAPRTTTYYGKLASSIGLPNTTFNDLQLQLCRSVNQNSSCRAQQTSRTRYPLFLFSPGFGNSRLLYTEFAISLASQGHVVITVDHPYDAPIVEFPDNTFIPAENISQDDASLSKLVQVRAADLSFVLNELPKRSSINSVIDVYRIMACGHSLGGATAAEVVRSDTRVIGGVNMDGRLLEPTLSSYLRKPFLQVGRPGHRSTDSTWKEFWSILKGPKLELNINGTTHGSFTDLSRLLDLFGLPERDRSSLDSVLGSISGDRAIRIMTELLQSFGHLASGGRWGSLLKVLNSIPEIKIIDSSLGFFNN